MSDLSNIYHVLKKIQNEVNDEPWVSIRLMDENLTIRVTTFIGTECDKSYEKQFLFTEINAYYADDLVGYFIKEVNSAFRENEI